MKKRTISALMAATMVLGSMTACGSGGASSEAASTNSTDTAASAAESATGEKEKVKLTIMFRDPGEGENGPAYLWLKKAADSYTSDKYDVEVDLAPITASTGDYYSKIALNLSSADACPDIILEDSYQVAADVTRCRFVRIPVCCSTTRMSLQRLACLLTGNPRLGMISLMQPARFETIPVMTLYPCGFPLVLQKVKQLR